MESFYGGRRGQSFVLVKRFKTVEEMVTAFKKGGDYREVNYGEWVVIDCLSKNNRDNGKVYVRGLDYLNEMGGAIYQGQFCGSQGNTPEIEIVQQDSIDELLSEIRGDSSYEDPVTHEIIGENGRYLGKAEDENWETVPGAVKDSNGEIIGFNDNIKYSYYTIKDVNENVIGCYVGLKIPRHVIDFEVEQVDSHTPAMIENLDNEHNFYDKWRLSVPKGIRGKDVVDIRYNEENSKLEVNYRDYTYSEDGVESGYQEIVDIKNVDHIVFDDSCSKLLVTYSDFLDGVRRQEYIEKPIKFLKDVSVDENEKKIKFVYSTYNEDGTHEEELIGESIKFPIDIRIDDTTKRYKITYNTYQKNEEGDFIVNDEGDKINEFEFLGNPIRSIKNATLNNETKKIHVIYDTPKAKYDGDGKVILKEDGSIDYEVDEFGNPIIEEDIGEPIKCVSNIFYDNETHTIKVVYNTSPAEETISEVIKTIDHVSMNSVTKCLEVFYNTGEKDIATDAINDIEDIVITDTYRLLVKYSDPNKRGNISYNEIDGYIDLGFIRGGGLQVYTVENLGDKTIEQLKEELTLKYGSTIPEGWSIAVTGVNGGTEYFIYDRTVVPPTWKSTGTNSMGNVDFVISSEQAQPDQQEIGGVWGISKQIAAYSI